MTVATVAGAKQQALKISCAAAQGVKTEAEVEDVPSQKIYNVHVTFLGKKPTDKEIDRVLRDCLTVAAKRDTTKDILASPWFRKRPQGNKNDDELLRPYGSMKYLSFKADDKSIGVRELQLRKKQ